MANDAFYQTMLPYAQYVSQRVSIPVSALLAQWANESARGTSDLAKFANNFGGIKYVGANTQDWKTSQGYAGYKSIQRFAEDVARIYGLSIYKAVRDVSDTDVEGTVKAIGNSLYAESHYARDGVPGKGLWDIIQADNLTQYDGSTSPQRAVGNMSKEDLIKYAGIGLAFVSLMALAGSKAG